MIVTRQTFESVIAKLAQAPRLSLDTETTGLRVYHGDRLFSVIIAIAPNQAFYFNFQSQPDVPDEAVLTPGQLHALGVLLSDPDKIWYMHSAKYDLSVLAKEGLGVAGTVHCTQAIERVVYNDYLPGGYDLDSCAERIGFRKDPTVEKYIEDHKLWTYTDPDKPGDRKKLKHFDRVPFNIIVPYGERDAGITFALGQAQEKALQEIADDTPKNLPSVLSILQNERRLTKTVARIESVGVKINRPYCVQAASYEADRALKSREEFKRLTGADFKASGKLFAIIFESEKEKWVYGETTKTGKINPSFDSEVLKTFTHPAARAILDYRDSKSRSDFFRGFLWHADSQDIVHPNFNPAGAATGRFTSSEPNFQNLTNEEDDEIPSEFPVRRAIIPRPGFVFYGRDWNAMEYVMMFGYAAKMWGGETEMVRQIQGGKDPHQATADLVTALGRMKLTRKVAKNGNFAELYGSGLDTLAATIRGTRGEAQALKDALREAAPEVRNLVNNVSTTARTRGFIRNWAGRRSYLKDPNFAYAMTNYLIQGGCADVNKFSLNILDEWLLGKKSRIVLNIHDEIVCEMAEEDAEVLPAQMKEMMSSVYHNEYLTLTSSGFKSEKSLGDLEDAA